VREVGGWLVGWCRESRSVLIGGVFGPNCEHQPTTYLAPRASRPWRGCQAIRSETVEWGDESAGVVKVKSLSRGTSFLMAISVMLVI
jgi:hypothetical protein